MKAVTKKTLEKAMLWMANGEVGQSSKYLCMTLCGIECRHNVPHDPADLNRCFEMFKAVPELKERFGLMRKSSLGWEKLVDNWDKLQSLFISEVGDNWEKGGSATMTYLAMKGLKL